MQYSIQGDGLIGFVHVCYRLTSYCITVYILCSTRNTLTVCMYVGMYVFMYVCMDVRMYVGRYVGLLVCGYVDM